MKLLLLTYYFPPGFGPGVARFLSWANHLATRGHDVTVVCANVHSQIRGGASQEPNPSFVHPSIRVVPLSGLGYDRLWQWMARRRLARLLDVFSTKQSGWGVAAAAYLARHAREDTVVVSTGGPWVAHLACLAARSVRTFPWIADYRDPWFHADSRYAGRPILNRVRTLDRAVHRTADRVTYTSAVDLRVALEAYGVPRHRGLVVRNGIEEGTFDRPGEASPPPRIVFGGNLYVAPEQPARGLAWLESRFYVSPLPYDYRPYSLVPLLRAVDRARARSGRPITVTAVGGTSNVMLHNALRLAGLSPRCEWADARPAIGKEELAGLYRTSAVAYLPLFGRADGVPIGRVPQKLFELLASDRPILASVPEGETKWLLRPKPGVFFLAGDADPDASMVVEAIHDVPARPAGRWKWRRESQARAVEGLARRVVEERRKPAGG